MDTILLIITGVLSRLIPHPANFTAVGSLAIFSGFRFGSKKAVFITITIMFITDCVFGFHSVMWATYGSMFLATVLGRAIRGKYNYRSVVLACLGSSVLFYIVTNFAVWAVPGSMYPKTLQGLTDSYIMAIPFFRNSLLGDLTYTGIFFGAYEFVSCLRRRPLKVILSHI
jgi:uncharacterized membrane protein